MITPRNHPIKFLLYFEWILIVIVALAELPRFPREEPRLLGVNLICLLLFGVLGFYLPKSSPGLKTGYLAASFGVFLVGTFLGKIRLIQLLCVILVIRISLILQSQARLFTTSLIFILMLFYQVDRFQTERSPFRYVQPLIRPPRGRAFVDAPGERIWFTAISSLILLGLVAVFVQLMIDAVLSERHAKEQLESANSQLRRYALRVEDTATLQERNRIAREIHDSLGHSLTAFNLHLEAAMRLLKSDPTEAQELLSEAKQLGSKALQEVRQSVSTLRSHPLQGKPLASAIQELLEDLTRSTGIIPIATFQLDHIPNQDYQTALYRITQEALTNIAKYAQATEVELSLIINAQQICLTIRDNGQGFVLAQTTSGFGLQGIRERTEALAGTCEITASPGQGCKITVIFQL
jgi:signal transduction histidine kinase